MCQPDSKNLHLYNELAKKPILDMSEDTMKVKKRRESPVDLRWIKFGIQTTQRHSLDQDLK